MVCQLGVSSQELVEHECKIFFDSKILNSANLFPAISPNVPDSFTYTPMCASDPIICIVSSVLMRFPKGMLQHLMATWTSCHTLFPEVRRLTSGSFRLIILVAGGNVNVTDEDDETPLFVVETEEVARFLVDNGADPTWKNHEGLTVC